MTNQGEGPTGAQAIAISRMNLQYWFNGPPTVPDNTDALSLFTFTCLDTSPGLGRLNLTCAPPPPSNFSFQKDLRESWETYGQPLGLLGRQNHLVQDPLLRMPALGGEWNGCKSW